jgi:adenine-specific DNA-methyltransferase
VTVRLEWDGKPGRVERLHLPFQTVETINESRATRERDTGALFGGDGPRTAERNSLIWGDNKLVLSSLLRDYAGAIKLIYIDPPFDTGTDFSYRVSVGDASITKLPSIIEEHAYRDTWGLGKDSYLTMLYERLTLMHELLAGDGLLFVHLGAGVTHVVRGVLDEIFGTDHFRNEIIWKRTSAHNDARTLGAVHETILLYSKGDTWTWNTQYVEHEDWYVEQYYRYRDADGRRFMSADYTGAGPGPPRQFGDHGELGPPPGRHWMHDQAGVDQALASDRIFWTRNGIPRLKRYLDESLGQPLNDLWTNVLPVVSWSKERLGYDTQKPEALLERVIKLGSNPDDLVADFFCGSGTTAAVAEKLGRRWIACDLGRFAIHITRKRLLNIPACHPFDIQNLGAHERQRWQIESGNGALRAYLDTILGFYHAEPIEGFIYLHGRKADRMVHVGATDAPVTIDETEDVMDEMADNGIEACDLLGWEWEMGLHDTISERARRRGLDVRPRQIPREAMERQVSEADAVRFFELAFVDLDVRRQGREACVVLNDFAIPSENLIPAKIGESITSWSDLVDYWSVDFDFSDEIFHNQWRAYRTRENPGLATQSDWHEYPKPGRYAIVVKIIDIFGNDTTKLAEVRIKSEQPQAIHGVPTASEQPRDILVQRCSDARR